MAPIRHMKNMSVKNTCSMIHIINITTHWTSAFETPVLCNGRVILNTYQSSKIKGLAIKITSSVILRDTVLCTI